MSNPFSHPKDLSTSTTDTVVDSGPPSALKQGGSTVLDHDPTPSVIPPESPRTLVLCFDGTGDKFDDDNSNIVQFVSMLKKGDQKKQMVYYHSGFGTSAPPNIPTWLNSTINWWKQTLDQQFAFSLRDHVLDGYKYLMEYYTAGDRICLFGFSRGAYTARALAGMLYKVGLLQAGNLQQVPFAYQMFSDPSDEIWEECNHFKRTFSSDVVIEFVGVWDTVNSVGVAAGKRLPFSSSNYAIRTFRQALALDEHRCKFLANVWNRDSDEQDPGTGPPKDSADEDFHTFWAERKFRPKEQGERTNFKEVWFAGCHCDVGGGSVPNSTANSLSRIPLRWMVRECFRTNSGIMFESKKLRRIGLDPSSLWDKEGKVAKRRPDPADIGSRKIPPPVPPPPKGQKLPCTDDDTALPTTTEEEEELLDALSPAYDQLAIQPWYKWKLIEWLPLTMRYQQKDNFWVTERKRNRGDPRIIAWQQEKKGLRWHRTVKMRMDAEYEAAPGTKYVPRAERDVTPFWEDLDPEPEE